MFRSISNTPIFRRLFLAFALAAVIPGIVISVLGGTYINALSGRGDAVHTSNRALKIVTTEQANLQHMHADLLALHSTTFANTGESGLNNPNMAKSLNDEILSLERDFNQKSQEVQQNYQINMSPNMSNIRSILTNDDPGSTLASDQQSILTTVMTQQWPDYKKALNNELQALQTKRPDHKRAHTILIQAMQAYTPLENSWTKLVDTMEQVGDLIATIGPSQTNFIVLATVIAILGTALVVITIGYVANLTITRPLRELAMLTKRIARGETSARAKIMGHDEIYMVATSMNNMLDNIVHLIQETQSQRDSLQAQVEKLVSEVSGVGEGDLRVQAEVTADALGVLADSFNYMVEELGSLIVRVKLVAHEVENSTVTILDHMTQLVESGDMQISQIAGAAMEVEHMAGMSRQVAERAQILYSVSREARQNAQGGREAVQQAVEGMGRIHENVQVTAGKVQMLGERSREINNIVEAIASIAHQTNRLALDAAIQAAMAGENGKGFGAVAADIRRLAERAKDQASMIARIVRSVRDDIGAAAVAMQDTERETAAGSKLTEEAGTALESIFTAVEQQAQDIENITQMAGQQLQSSSAVVQIMHGISESTQKSTLSTREASQNMERLARLVEQLRASTEAFKLRENEGYYVPSSGVNVTMEENPNNPMTVSGIFRMVSASVLPSNGGTQNALPPGYTPDAFSFYPMTPNQQNSTWSAPMQPSQPEPQWYEEAFDEQASNGSRNR